MRIKVTAKKRRYQPYAKIIEDFINKNFDLDAMYQEIATQLIYYGTFEKGENEGNKEK